VIRDRPVEEIELAAYHAAYRADGHGRAAHDPAKRETKTFATHRPRCVSATQHLVTGR
jgi:hypothetical protein